MRSRRSYVNPFLVIGLLLLAVIGLVWVNARSVMPIIGQDDFTTGWVSANMYLMKGISPYDYRVTQEISRISSGTQTPVNLTQIQFTEPFYALIIYAPFSLVDIHLARALWLTMIELSFVAIICGYLSLSGWKLSFWAFGLLLLWAVVWYNGAHALFLGQFSVFIIFTMMGSMWLFLQGHDEGAGFLLALSLAKPELSLFVVAFMFIWSVSTGRTRFFVSLLAGIIFLLAVTIILAPAWPLQWLTSIVNTAGHPDWYNSALSKAAFALPGIRKPLFIALHCSFGILLLIEWAATLGKNQRHFYLGWLFTLTISALIVPRSDTSVTLLILPVAFQLMQVWQARWGRAGNLITWLTMILILVGSWAFILPASHQMITEPLFLFILPPLLSLMALLWIRYWVIRPSRLPLELMKDLD